MGHIGAESPARRSPPSGQPTTICRAAQQLVGRRHFVLACGRDRPRRVPPGDHRLGWSRPNWVDGAAELVVEGAQTALRLHTRTNAAADDLGPFSVREVHDGDQPPLSSFRRPGAARRTRTHPARQRTRSTTFTAEPESSGCRDYRSCRGPTAGSPFDRRVKDKVEILAARRIATWRTWALSGESGVPGSIP